VSTPGTRQAPPGEVEASATTAAPFGARLAWPARAATVALLVAAPFLLGDFRLLLLGDILVYGLLAASLALLVGYTGLPSLGHAAFFGVGGYVAALVAETTANGPAQLAVAVAAAALVALGTGWLAVRTRGVYLLMLTLAFAQLLYSLALTWTPVTGGANGLPLPPVSLLPGDDGSLLAGDRALYWYVLAGFLLGYLVLRLVVGSPFGRALAGIRENEARMRSLGYSVVGCKLAAFCIAGAVGGLAGALFAQHQLFISPSNISFELSAVSLVVVVIGGARTLYGPVLGAAVFVLVREELSSALADHWQIGLGAVFILVVYLLPGGIAGLGRRFEGWRPGTAATGPGP